MAFIHIISPHFDRRSSGDQFLLFSYLYGFNFLKIDRCKYFDLAFNLTCTTSKITLIAYCLSNTACMGLIMEIMSSISSTVGILDLSLLNVMHQNLIQGSQQRSSVCFPLYLIDQCSFLLAHELL